MARALFSVLLVLLLAVAATTTRATSLLDDASFADVDGDAQFDELSALDAAVQRDDANDDHNVEYAQEKKWRHLISRTSARLERPRKGTSAKAIEENAKRMMLIDAATLGAGSIASQCAMIEKAEGNAERAAPLCRVLVAEEFARLHVLQEWRVFATKRERAARNNPAQSRKYDIIAKAANKAGKWSMHRIVEAIKYSCQMRNVRTEASTMCWCNELNASSRTKFDQSHSVWKGFRENEKIDCRDWLLARQKKG